MNVLKSPTRIKGLSFFAIKDALEFVQTAVWGISKFGSIVKYSSYIPLWTLSDKDVIL